MSSMYLERTASEFPKRLVRILHSAKAPLHSHDVQQQTVMEPPMISWPTCKYVCCGSDCWHSERQLLDHDLTVDYNIPTGQSVIG